MKITLIKKYSLLCALSFIVCFLPDHSSAQQKVSDDVQNMMNIALSQMERENYEGANVTFRKILATKETMPTDLAYHFAVTLYMIGQYENSKNFLERYFGLTRRSGDFYEQGKELEALIAERVEEIHACNLCDSKGYLLRTCSKCDGEGHEYSNCNFCKGKGIVSCTKCEGQGVVVSKNVFNEKVYQTCTKCESKGHHLCDECKGEKVVQNKCRLCIGTGRESSKTLCEHDENL